MPLMNLNWRSLPSRIAVIGDSIALGRTATPGASWSDILYQRHVGQSPATNMVFNLGIGGNTSIDVRRRAKAELSERNIEATILMLGVNDLRHEIVTGEQQVPFDVFKKAYSEIVEICLEFGSLEILSLFPLQPNKKNTLGAHQYRLSDWEKYNNSIRDIASYYGVHMTNLENSLTSLEGNNLHFDLVHPNSHGHRAIFNALDASFKT